MSADFALRNADGYGVVSSTELYAGKIFSLRSDQVKMADGSISKREIVSHPGAVAVLALDAEDQVVLIEQYRHSAAGYLWELPAGLLDVPGEPALGAAQRELTEEVGLVAAQWHTLVDLRTAVGFSDEAVRVFLARDLSAATDKSFLAEGEEADIVVRRMPLAECVAACMRGEIENSLAVAGILATALALPGGLQQLRPASAPWAAQKTS